jgi:catechol 2,3-dioxygenase-like lactoylglutathione lyase family enzyme
MTTGHWGDDLDWAHVTFTRRPLPEGVRHDIVHIDVGSTLGRSGCASVVNRLAVVEHGRIELVSHNDVRLTLGVGAVFVLPANDLSEIRNAGSQPAVITTVHRLPTAVRSRRDVEPTAHPSLRDEGAPTMQMKLELVLVPVTDVDRAKAFFSDRAGFAVDVDVTPAPNVRVVQLTPPGSSCSITIGTGLPHLSDMAPGSIKGIHLVVDNIERAREELVSRGVTVGDIDDTSGGGVRYAEFSDPDGNLLLLQEMAWRTGDAF